MSQDAERQPEHTVEAAQALHGRNVAMLSPDESEVLNYFIQQGRKFGVTIGIDTDADPNDLQAAGSPAQEREIMRRANSTVKVTLV